MTQSRKVKNRMLRLPENVVGLRLARINRNYELILCTAMRFDKGHAAVDMALRRAQISGRVEIAGQIIAHFADALDDAGDIIVTVALDAKSYNALKTKWMRCKVERSPRRRNGAKDLIAPEYKR